MALRGVQKTKVHIITDQHREFDRWATPWEIQEMKNEGYHRLVMGQETFDFRCGVRQG